MVNVWLEREVKRLSDQSFEDIVSASAMSEQEVMYVTVRNPPAILVNTCRRLRRRHKNLTSVSAVQKYAVMLGAYRIGLDGQTGTLIRRVSEKHELAPAHSHRLHYTYASPDAGRGFVRVALYELSNNILSDLSEDLDVSKGVLVVLSALYGLDASTKWVPKPYKVHITKELDNFREFVRIQGSL